MHISVNAEFAPRRLAAGEARGHVAAMRNRRSPPHFLRAWRKARDLTLEQVAERVETIGRNRAENGAPELVMPRSMTHSSLSRIERGLQPYNQALLEILAEVYQTDPASLLMRNPIDPDGIWSVWERLAPAQRVEAVAMLAALADLKKAS